MTNIQNLSKKCLVCGDIFYKTKNIRPYQWNIQKYCSRKCSLSKTSIGKQDQSNHPRYNENYIPWNKGTVGLVKPNSGNFKKGLIPWTKGKKFPELSGENHPNWKEKTIKICEYCSKDILLPPHRLKQTKRFFCNRVCWALGTRGDGSPVFKGEDAVAPLRKRIMELPEHKEWHSTILKRDNYLCIFCKSRKDLEVDHIKRFLFIVNENNIKNTEDARNCKELWEIKNGRTLCRECHRKTDTYGTKGTGKQLLK